MDSNTEIKTSFINGISFQANSNFSTKKEANITNKYAPLCNIVFDDQKTAHTFLDAFGKSRNIQFSGLELITTFQGKLTEDELTPIIIVSSGRSKWIHDQIIKDINSLCEYDPHDQTTEDINPLGKFDLIGYLKNKKNYAEADPHLNNRTPLWYSPLRTYDYNIKKLRKTFFIVHHQEYPHYKDKLEKFKDIGFEIVGFKFTLNGEDAKIAGFGASRYAAIEFAKQIFTPPDENKLNNKVKNNGTTSKKNYAWIVDDNLAHIKNMENDLGVFEGRLKQNANAAYAIGFSGATKIENDIDVKLNEDTIQKNFTIEKGLIQQAALWNISNIAKDYSDKNKINFRVEFITSNEDTSFSAAQQDKFFITKAFTNRKIFTDTDDINENTGLPKVNQEKSDLIKRSINLANQIKLQNDTLSKLITAYRNNWQEAVTIDNDHIISIAIEQLAAAAIKKVS
ncbi:hypothetical protein PWG14_16925 (plasmid) [Chromobacterium amazonense]|uniref:hypothetical protein n=1 Tax=Chromobacterium amazonense TaxID=1382803 RepID=UPI00237D65DA|nr:hypothetical protein [Chromobacterium amazonense]MDE1714214.1 hypothetical protein [Chromobacterium amazonense]